MTVASTLLRSPDNELDYSAASLDSALPQLREPLMPRGSVRDALQTCSEGKQLEHTRVSAADNDWCVSAIATRTLGATSPESESAGDEAGVGMTMT